VRDLALPENTALATMIRDGALILPRPDDVLEAGDEMLFFAGGAVENQARALVNGATTPLRDSDRPDPLNSHRTGLRTDELPSRGRSIHT